MPVAAGCRLVQGVSSRRKWPLQAVSAKAKVSGGRF
jgi:hypothetical protein